MSLVSWILKDHPFFCDLRKHLLNIIAMGNIQSIDELVVRARRPIRTVILMLNELIQDNQVEIDNGFIVIKGDKRSELPFKKTKNLLYQRNIISLDIINSFLDYFTSREEPALLWGQRRLIPESAIARAVYIVSRLENKEGRILFIGDDDLVSPIFAKLLPSWKVYVVDIDQGVLNKIKKISSLMEAKVITYNADISQFHLHFDKKCDVVVCDPFPSGDGSFESLFWYYSSNVLCNSGLLITTVAPSHKPDIYSVEALKELNNLGFCLMDLQADFGMYEVFDFELTNFESEFLHRHGFRSRISQTKSILTAKYFKSDKKTIINNKKFNYQAWYRSTMSHYLTIQAGIEKQIQIAANRGPENFENLSKVKQKRHGLQVDLILPKHISIKKVRKHRNIDYETIKDWKDLLSKELNLKISEEEIEEFFRLSKSSKLRNNGILAKLGLAIRAIESWERWRLDE